MDNTFNARITILKDDKKKEDPKPTQEYKKRTYNLKLENIGKLDKLKANYYPVGYNIEKIVDEAIELLYETKIKEGK